jgi:hypothetical protein
MALPVQGLQGPDTSLSLNAGVLCLCKVFCQSAATCKKPHSMHGAARSTTIRIIASRHATDTYTASSCQLTASTSTQARPHRVWVGDPWSATPVSSAPGKQEQCGTTACARRLVHQATHTTYVVSSTAGNISCSPAQVSNHAVPH